MSWCSVATAVSHAETRPRALDVPFVHVWTFEDGLATRFRQFLDTAGWVEALSPISQPEALPFVDMTPDRVSNSSDELRAGARRARSCATTERLRRQTE